MVGLPFAFSAMILQSIQYIQKGVVLEPVWIAVSIIALVVIAVLLLRGRGKQYKKPSNLAVLGISLVVLGITFGDDRLIGYSFMGAGVLLSVIDAIRNRKQ